MTTAWNPYAAHPPECPCPACGWARVQNAELDARHDPGSQRAACGHPAGCACPPHVKQRSRIAAREQAAAELVRQERARRQIERARAEWGLEPEPPCSRHVIPAPDCGCRKCLMRRMELVLEQPQQIQADFRTRYYAGRPCVRHAVPAPDCSSCAANAGLTVIRAGEEITSGTITVDIPGSAGFRDPAARERTSVPAELPPDPAGEVEAALRDFDAWYAAGRGTLPDPEPLPAGTCASCHLSPAVRLGKCFWCDLAEQNPVRTRDAAASHRGKYVISGPVIRAALVTIWLLIGVLVVTGVL